MESCKDFVRRIVRCLNEWRAVRNMLGELQGVVLSGELQGVC